MDSQLDNPENIMTLSAIAGSPIIQLSTAHNIGHMELQANTSPPQQTFTAEPVVEDNNGITFAGHFCHL